ncbi:similar to Saccharomyces cerevisiae YJL048C UBX6 UBX (ubiquitin regulatory X) domain-containing protein that interacts with Cdc48p [Maudiozyma saulgeensis]|uniref:Similar to Saccharomyces cerevisiae YJL048C UBX6 UBX (Ubiquitin regulatory X) domain-containing protein that interacts with Cdc48p n=1 Tax=Maudiozyma saulgeensis TaxID=1789683 RepID=A0A1X7R0N2_9SACH|nr:similar to Saccharomyces cerevisiae YJL048C UBX6 UBX (ubiquitin regulatory X) domain-containing protein that interacts with Cdc48p [Kazachstania saulgeensis]
MVPEFSLLNTDKTLYIDNVPDAFYRAMQTDSSLLVIIQNKLTNNNILINDLTKFNMNSIIIQLSYNTTQLEYFKKLFPKLNSFNENNTNLILIKDSDILNNWDLTNHSWLSIEQYLESYFRTDNNNSKTIAQQTFQPSRLNYDEMELIRIKKLIYQDKREKHFEVIYKDNNNNNNINRCTNSNKVSKNYNNSSKGKNHTLRIKLDDASTIVHTFNSCTDSLLTVKKYIEIVTGKPIPIDFSFHNVLPKRKYTKQEELQSLNSLNLITKSSLYLFKNKEYIRELRRSRDASQDFKYINICISKIKSLLQFMRLIKRETTIGSPTHNMNSKYSLSNNVRHGSSCPFNDHLP